MGGRCLEIWDRSLIWPILMSYHIILSKGFASGDWSGSPRHKWIHS